MQTYMTPEQTAEVLKIDLADVMNFIENGRLRAIRLGNAIRIREMDLERFLDACAVGGATEPPKIELDHQPNIETLADGTRWCLTRRGKRFRVRGSVAQGAEVWPGQMKYPVRFPQDFLRALLKQFSGKVVDVGGGFDGPTPGSIGEFIKDRLKLKLCPAVYLAALLIDEGYAESAGRGKLGLLPTADLSLTPEM